MNHFVGRQSVKVITIGDQVHFPPALVKNLKSTESSKLAIDNLLLTLPQRRRYSILT